MSWAAVRSGTSTSPRWSGRAATSPAQLGRAADTHGSPARGWWAAGLPASRRTGTRAWEPARRPRPRLTTPEAEAEIQPPSQEACRRFSGFIGNGRCVRLALALGQSDLVGGVNRPQQFDGAKGTGLLHMVGQERHRPPNAAVAFLALHRGLLSSAQTSQSPRMTGVDCSRWTASDTPRDPPPRPMPPDTTGLAREHDVTLDDVPSRRPRYSLQGLPGQVVSAIVDTWSRFTPRGRRPLAQKA